MGQEAAAEEEVVVELVVVDVDEMTQEEDVDVMMRVPEGVRAKGVGAALVWQVLVWGGVMVAGTRHRGVVCG